MKKLFLFAAYDSGNVIGEALAYYLDALSRLGDIVLFMDNNLDDDELAKLPGAVKFAKGEKHGEYDFGSYKRAYAWSMEHLDLASYDFCYLLNDSVFGPFFQLDACLEKMEASGKGVFGMVLNPHGKKTHLQSWFIGMDKEVFTSGWFKNFILGVKALPDKTSVCNTYETGFSKLLAENGIAYTALFEVPGKAIYNRPAMLFRKKLPFVKKSSFTRHNGSLHLQVKYILDNCDKDLRKAILSDMTRLHGEDYVHGMLSANRTGIALRYISYIFGKIRNKARH